MNKAEAIITILTAEIRSHRRTPPHYKKTEIKGIEKAIDVLGLSADEEDIVRGALELPELGRG